MTSAACKVVGLAWAAALLVALATPASGQVSYGTPSGWRERPEAAFGFSVEAPIEARRLEDSQDVPSLSLDFRDQYGQVMVQAIDFGRAGVAPNVAADVMLDGMVSDFAGEQQVVLVAKQVAVVDGALARDATYRSDALNISTKVRFILAQGRLYTLMGVGLADGAMPPSYDRVVKSFKLLAPRPPGLGSR